MIYENIYEWYLHKGLEDGVSKRYNPPKQNKLQCNAECINMYIFGYMMGEQSV